MERTQGSAKFPLGSKLPRFALPSTEGATITNDHLAEAKAALVIFTCNHCPYVKGSEVDLVQRIRSFLPQGLKVVAISSNDSKQYPEDDFEHMKDKARQMELPFPYLYDESQEIAKLFDAACTPESYLFDANAHLVYHGAVNDSPRDPTKVTTHYLAEAIQNVLAGKTPVQQFVNPLGCSIKWKI